MENSFNSNSAQLKKMDPEVLNKDYGFSIDSRKETATGLRYCHSRINDNTTKTLESTAFLYALIEILLEKGMLPVEELDSRKKKIASRLVEKFSQSGTGLMYQDSDLDKYEFDEEAEVDCQSNLAACKAVCCKLPFALSEQDVEEGIVKWNFKRPYLIAHDEDGYCVHLDRETFHCTIRDNRPLPCRGFDCRSSERWPIWENYSEKRVNVQFIERINNQEIGRMFFEVADNGSAKVDNE